jgi:hypothetical protein
VRASCLVDVEPCTAFLSIRARGNLGRKQPGDLRGCPCRSACRRPQARAPSWLSSMANVIHAPAIDRQHLGRDEAGIRLDQESHGGGNVLRRANPTDHGALAH